MRICFVFTNVICSPSTKLSVRSAVICSTLTEDIVAFSGECLMYLNN